VNSKILGLGPEFIVKLEAENGSENLIKNIKILSIYDNKNVQMVKGPK
jgi:hypothetical protein